MNNTMLTVATIMEETEGDTEADLDNAEEEEVHVEISAEDTPMAIPDKEDPPRVVTMEGNTVARKSATYTKKE